MRRTCLALLPVLVIGCVEPAPAPISLPAECELSDPGLQLPLDADSHVLVGTVFDHALDSHLARVAAIDLALGEASAADADLEYVAVHCNNQETTTRSKNEASVELARFLAVELEIAALIGPAASGRVELVYDALAVQEDLLIVSPSATSPALIEIDGTSSTDASPGLFWRSVPPDSFQGRAIAQDMRTAFDPSGVSAFRRAPSTNVAVLLEEGPYGEGIAAEFEAAFTPLGGTVTPFTFSSVAERNAAIETAAAGAFDELLFLSSDSEDVRAFLLQAATSPELAQTPLFLTDSGHQRSLYQEVADQASAIYPHIRGTWPSSPSGAVHERFVDAYTAAANTDPTLFPYTENAYDAAWLVLYAHAAAPDRRSGTELARGMRRLSNGSTIEVGPASWMGAHDLLRTGQTIDVVGTSGPLDFDTNTGETHAPTQIWTLDQGEFVDVGTFLP